MKRPILASVLALMCLSSVPLRADYVERSFLRRDMPPLCGSIASLQVGRAAVADVRQVKVLNAVVSIGEYEYPLDPCGIKRALEAMDAGLANARAQGLSGALTVDVFVRLDGANLTPFSCVAYDSDNPYEVAGRREIVCGLQDSLGFFQRLIGLKMRAR